MGLFDDLKTKAGKGQEGRRIVTFQVSGKECAVDLMFIKEIIYMRTILPLPEAADDVEGVIDLRGKVVPVIDLKKKLGAPSDDSVKPEHILIVEVGRRKLGLMVDLVLGVISAPEDQFQVTHNFMDREVSSLQGIFRLKDRLIMLLDLEHLLADSDKRGAEASSGLSA